MECLSCCLISCLIKFGIVLAVIKAILKLRTARDRSPTCLTGKTAIVTGANTGIGYHTAQDFAKRGARVILACRDKNRAEKARDKIIEATGNPNVVVRLIDFSSLDSVRAFAKEINSTEERLDILVNNAGAGYLDYTKSKDGLSLIVQINHFGPFLLTNLLIDILKKSAPSRIVNVSSMAVHVANLDVNDLNAFPGDNFRGKFVDYANTKLLNILFTNELARRLQGTGVTANSLHPGTIYTDFFRNLPQWAQTFTNRVVKFFMKTSEEGAQTSIYVSVSKDLERHSGEFFRDCNIPTFYGMPKIAKDEGFAKKAWEKSEDFVKLTEEERRL